MRKNSEHKEQVALFELAALHESKHPELELMHAVPNGGHRHIAVARKLQAEGVKAGVPDIELPVAREQHTGLHIEMKIKPNKPTPQQLWWTGRLTEQGRLCIVCYSAQEAWEAIKNYLKKEMTT